MFIQSLSLKSFCVATLIAVAGNASAASQPAKPDLPADFVPQVQDFADKNENGQFMGIAQFRGRLLKLGNGMEAAYVVRAPGGQLKGDPLVAGDLIVDVSGIAKKNGDLLNRFKVAADRAQQGGGTLAFARWRKGVTENITVKFDGPQVPDLTAGGEHDPAKISWNLGTTGAAGWIWSGPHEGTQGARQIYITAVAKGSPAAGVLSVGDVILGAHGKPFTRDARKEFANALSVAESKEKQGKLVLSVWNGGKTREVTVPLKVMGGYSATAPFGCDKSKRIADEACEYLKKNGIGSGIQGNVNALGLLATGREDVMPIVREHAAKIAAAGKDLQFKKAMESWSWGYNNLFLTEYYLATKDESVLPAIREYSTMIARGQSRNGNWGHSMCVPYNFSDGPLYGICPGYGALNQAGLPCMISMALATKCGVTNDDITLALKRGSNFFRFYMDRGSVPYGDHSPQPNGHEDNGKSSLTAVMFDLLGDREAAEFFTRMTIASFNEREGGHTGNYFNFLWGALGAARGGDAAASAFMKKLEWFYDLERRGQGNFVYQGKPGMTDTKNAEHQYKGWDCTGARLLAYSLPLKKLYITGKGRTLKDITGKELTEALEAGELTARQYADLPTGELLAKLGNWSPAVRSHAAAALESKPDNVVKPLIAMLDSGNRYARYGACQGLSRAGRASAEAADAVVAKGLRSPDQTLKFFAMRAFSSYNDEMGLSAMAGRVLPAMLEIAAASDPGDPDGRMKGELGYHLFYSGNAAKVKAVARSGEGISKVDSDVLVKGIRELLKVNNGGHRSCVTAAYGNLTEAQLKLLWKDIYRAVREQAPADIMFSNGARISGIQLMTKHRTREGLDTAIWFLTNQKGHGAPAATDEVLKIIIDGYGGHAKAKIPDLEKCEKYFASDKGGKVGDAIRAAIKTIQAAPTPKWEMTSIAEYLK
jgi:hypothetical protein